MNSNIRLLYVDDEIINIELFKLNFNTEFELFTTCNPEEALEIIKYNKIDILLTDYKMPKLTGMELINIVKNEIPETICLILSGYLENEVITDKSKIFQFVMKPYKHIELLTILSNAYLSVRQ